VFADQSGTQIILPVGPTELRLLYFFMIHPGRVYTKIELLDEVWGDRGLIHERTIATYVKRLRTALKPAGREWMIEAVRTFGYRFAS
jgi:two-component system, OmpR family, phosphate regulon response regulator PhoB